jgi:hypothetical protein
MDPIVLPDAPFTIATAASLGLSAPDVRRLQAAGTLRRMLRGVYVDATVPITTEVKAAAAALVVQPDSVVVDRTAAWIWGYDAHRYRELDVVPPVETYALRGRTRSRRTELRTGVRDLAADDWMILKGMKVTTPIRTALDLGCLLERRDAMAAMDALSTAGGFSAIDLTRRLPRFRRRRGVVQLRQLAPLVRGGAESPRESWLRLDLLDAGLPEPDIQHWVVVDGVTTYRLDLAYPHARIAIEYDGREHHSAPADRLHDEMRRDCLETHGWTVIVVTADDLAPGSSQAWIRQVQESLALAQRRPRRSYR